MRYRNVKTGQVVVTSGAVTGEDWVLDETQAQGYDNEDIPAPEDSGEPEEAQKPEKPKKGGSRSKKAGEK